METNLTVLLKFGQRQHLEEFRQRGSLYMNPLRYFTALEQDAVRGDSFEGTSRILQPKDVGQIRLGEGKNVIVIEPHELTGPMKHGSKARFNVFCMFSITKPFCQPLVDPRNFLFGDSFVAITNGAKFFERIELAFSRENLSGEGGFVEYYDAANHSGDTGPFRKPNTFSYQHEFRFVVANGSLEPLKIYLGDSTDIMSEIYPLAEINDLIKVNHQPDSL
jgi:hypothetical protein